MSGESRPCGFTFGSSLAHLVMGERCGVGIVAAIVRTGRLPDELTVAKKMTFSSSRARARAREKPG
jgi:hypothetical protein